MYSRTHALTHSLTHSLTHALTARLFTSNTYRKATNSCWLKSTSVPVIPADVHANLTGQVYLNAKKVKFFTEHMKQWHPSSKVGLCRIIKFWICSWEFGEYSARSCFFDLQFAGEIIHQMRE